MIVAFTIQRRVSFRYFLNFIYWLYFSLQNSLKFVISRHLSRERREELKNYTGWGKCQKHYLNLNIQ